jgi:hypothetical protein
MSQHLPVELKKTMKNLSQNSQYPSWNSNTSLQLHACLIYCSILKMEAVYSLETLVPFFQATLICHKIVLSLLSVMRTTNPTEAQ